VRREYLDASFAEVKAKYGTFEKYLTRGLDVDPEARAELEQELLAG
jgi:protein-tyrosine phosphatase